MERLTERGPDGNVLIPIGRTGNTVESVFDRLAAYENAMSIERAQELAQAEKDGRLVVLPDGMVSMIMAAFVDEGDKDMLAPITEARGEEVHVTGLLSYLANAVAKYNHTDYVSLLKALIENPIV